MPSAKRQPSTAPAVRSPEALASLNFWLETLVPNIRKRGEEDYARGQVTAVWSNADHDVEAEVEGKFTDDVTLFLTRGRWSSQCSCPMGANCRHAAAAACAWIANQGRDLGTTARAEPFDGEDDFDDDLPAAPPSVSLPPRGQPAPPKKKLSFRDEWSPAIAAKLGRPLSAEEGRQLGQLAALFDDFNQSHRCLNPEAMHKHGFGHLLPSGAQTWAPVFHGWWDYNSAPSDPWKLWQYIAYDAERAGRPISEAFRAMTDTSAVCALLDERLLQQELSEWRHALAAPESFSYARPKSAAEIAGLRLRITLDALVYIEVRAAAEKPWRWPAQPWLRSLASAFPADFDHLAPAEAALGAALAAESRTHYYSLGGKKPVGGDSVGRLLRCTAARGAIVLPDERPFALEPAPLVYEAAVSAKSATRLMLRLVTPDGRDASAAKLLVGRPAALYLFEGAVWPGPAPLPAAQLPIAALADERIIGPLRKAGVRLPPSVEVKIRRIALRPKLSCQLEDPENEYDAAWFRARLTARADDPPCEQAWSGHGGWHWTEQGAPPLSRPDEAWLEFDLGPAHAVSARFADFRLTWDDWAGAWSRYTTKNFPDEFIAWHATLPADLEVELSPNLAGLLGAPLWAHVDFSALPAEGSGRDWFDLTVALRIEDTTLSADEIALLLKARGKWVRLSKHGWRRLELASAGAGGDAADVLERLGLGAADVLATGRPATHRLHVLQLAGEAGALEARDTRLAAALRERAASIAATPPPPLPAGLGATLRPYQVEGFHFLAHLADHRFGGVLADDMGLGKTVQTLAWLLHLAATPESGRAPQQGEDPTAPAPFRALVVCPKSVTHGWLAETARFAPGLKTEAFTPVLANSPGSAVAAQLLVANYAQLRLHAAWFQECAWDAVVLDEGQFIKNPASLVAAVARALPSRHRLVLTGTPIENRLTDLWSLFAFAQPGLLGTQPAFRRQYPDDDPAAHSRLHRRVRHFLLRRTKAQAAPDLPLRTEDDLVVELEGGQRTLYDAELKRARAQILGIETDRALDKVRFNVLASLLRLRQICCHPALIDPAHAALPSAKLDALLERIEELREEGHQALVFSQFVGMLEIIRARLNETGIAHLMLTGATENRAALVEEFQRDSNKTVFLLSLKAAGFGLNLTAASYAILYDPWWNPAVEAQAIDRTHRIGQTKPVIAYRLLAAETVEQKIRALQQEKAALAAAVVQEESLASVLDLESLRRILA
jgi:hypothetical protein